LKARRTVKEQSVEEGELQVWQPGLCGVTFSMASQGGLTGVWPLPSGLMFSYTLASINLDTRAELYESDGKAIFDTVVFITSSLELDPRPRFRLKLRFGFLFSSRVLRSSCSADRRDHDPPVGYPPQSLAVSVFVFVPGCNHRKDETGLSQGRVPCSLPQENRRSGVEGCGVGSCRSFLSCEMQDARWLAQ
jgi:hypothetical protein